MYNSILIRTNPHKRPPMQFLLYFIFTNLSLLASLHSILYGIISRLPNPRLKIQVNKFSFLRSPLSICISIVDQLIWSRISHFSRGVRQLPFRLPFNFIAGGFSDEEGIAAASVSVVVNAFLDCEVEDITGGDFGCYLNFRMLFFWE